jgi:endonuclease III
MNKEKRAELIKIFGIIYKNPKSALNFTNEYELLISVMLSAQCTDAKVNQVTPKLFKSFDNFKALSKAKITKVESIIKPINYYKTKSKNIIDSARIICKQHNSSLPNDRQSLLSLPGVGQKTANVVLGELGIEKTLPVDTHVFRLSHRLGLSSGKTPSHVEEDLKKLFPPNEWRQLHHSLILHGRAVCKAQRPLCKECLLGTICPSKTN